MTARLPPDLLSRSAEEASRLLALNYLDEISRAEARLADPSETEALHDFRVGLRRLRSSIRAYRAQLKGSVSKRMRRRLRSLTLATNAGRDTEVQLAWLRQQAEHMAADETEGLAWMIGRLEGRKSEALDTVTAGAARRFIKTATKLRPRLGTFRIEVRTGRGHERPSFGQVTGELILRHVAELSRDLKAVRKAEDGIEVHTARIGAKRLRYLLEPLTRRAPRVKSLVDRLKALQDLLGDLHDMRLLADEIESSLATLSSNSNGRPSGTVAGLIALQRLATQQAAAAYTNFESQWSAGRAKQFLSRAEELGRNLGRKEATPATATAAAGVPPLRVRATSGNGKACSLLRFHLGAGSEGGLVDPGFAQLRQFLVGSFLFLKSLLQQLGGLGVTQ